MKSGAVTQDKISPADGPAQRGYAAWKRAKIEQGLKQAEDRDTLIPVEQVWRDLKPER